MVCLQDCVVLVINNHTIRLLQSPLISELTCICPVAASCVMPSLSCSFGVLCAPLAPFVIPVSKQQCSSTATCEQHKELALKFLFLALDWTNGGPETRAAAALVVFSTFEPIIVTPNVVLKRNGVRPWVLRTQCFVQGNGTPTLPHSFGNSQGAAADSRYWAGNCRRPLYELNTWMWSHGRKQPRRVTVRAAEDGSHI